MKKLILTLVAFGLMVGSALAIEPAAEDVDVTLNIERHGELTFEGAIDFNLENGATTDQALVPVELACNYRGMLQVGYEGELEDKISTLLLPMGAADMGDYFAVGGGEWLLQVDLNLGDDYTLFDADLYNGQKIGAVTVTVVGN